MPTLIQDPLIEPFHLSFEQTVPRSLVHKRSLENVLLTEVKACGGDRFLCAGRVPTAHRFFNDADRTPQKDIFFYTELGRQASLAISHTFLGVSREDIFIFEQSKAAVTDAVWRCGFHSTPESVVVEIQIREVEKRRNNSVSRVVAEHIMSIEGEQVFHGTGAWTVQPAALFQRLRRMSLGRSLPVSNEIPLNKTVVCPDRLRREGAANVVISLPERVESRAEFVASLIVDRTHRYFFDHPCDHVPGMLLLEGCGQLGLAAVVETTSLPLSEIGICAYEVNFAQFVENGLPTRLTALLNTAGSNWGSGLPTTVDISISQQNIVLGTATMSFAFPI